MWQKALIEFENLYQEKYTESNLIEQLINAAFNASEFNKMRLYVGILPKEQRIEWRKRLRGQEMILAFDGLKKKYGLQAFTQFKKSFQLLLQDCNPFPQWIDFAKLSYKRKFPKLNRQVYLELLDYCSLDDQKLNLLYLLKKHLNERELIKHIIKQKPGANKTFKKKLRKIHIEALLQVALKLHKKWAEQSSVLNEALAVFSYDLNTRIMLGWNLYHQKKYKNAQELFALLWHKYGRRTALEGLLFSMAARGEIDEAIKLARRHRMNSQLLSLLKTKLSDLPNDSDLALNIAQLILKYDPFYLSAHTSIAWHFIHKKQWSKFDGAIKRWQKNGRKNQTLDAPEPIEMISLLGWSYYLRDQYTKAYNAFADAYRRSHNIEAEKSAVNGLLYSSYQGNKWSELINLAKEKPGLLLSNEQERDVVNRLALGSLTLPQITVANGYFEALKVEEVTVFEQPSNLFDNLFEALPGFTWGSLRDDFGNENTVSYIINQGIDWTILPGNIMLNTFVEYRSINNELQFFNDDNEAVIGIDFHYRPFHFGVEYIIDHWQGENVGRYYFSWYHDWYKYVRRRGRREKSWLSFDAYSGSTYGRITRMFNGGTTIQGSVSQGIDWFTFADDITFNTSIEYRFRARDFDETFYDAHGPSISIEFQKLPFVLGVDYSLSYNSHLDTTENAMSLYFRWYYQWDLK